MDIAIAALNEVANARSEATGRVSDVSRHQAQIPEASGSPHIPSSSSNASQTTIADATTPPTSEEQSSHSHDSLSQLSQLAPSQPSIPPTHSEATNAGQKRTRDGFRKLSEPEDVGQSHGHSRDISAISMASSSVTTRDLTAELRTRLTYAMVKVNKGWETLPIDEVESLASQSGSPGTSSSSTLNGRRPMTTSPYITLANAQLGSTTSKQTLQVQPQLSQREHHTDELQPTRTYEAFWAQQGQKQSGPSSFTSPTSTTKSLVPSTDMLASPHQSGYQRSPTKQRPAPGLHMQTSDLSQNGQRSSGTPAPSTPSRSQHLDGMMHTPAQQSLQEQDAIETLLLMGSPGHPGNMGNAYPPPPSSKQQLLLRSPLRAGHRKVEFSVITPDLASESSTLRPTSSRRAPKDFRKLRDDEMDNLLDSVVDDESSDDEIEIPMTPRKLAAARA